MATTTPGPVGERTRPPAPSRTPSLRMVATTFLRRPTPWLLGGLTVAAAVGRIAVGGFTRTDVVVAVAMLAGFPFLEWVVHTALLHWRPRRVGGVTVDPLVARRHRQHHADPKDVALVFIPLQTLAGAIVATIGVGWLAFPRPGLGLTFITVQGLLGTGYEWVHYLIHTEYRPRTQLYRAVWRNHRLHHYKNEHYWFTVTTSGTADRVLGTYPEPSQVPTSPTARALHADA